MWKGWSRQEWSWAFYDWANSAYALVVMTSFFPVFLTAQVEEAGGSTSSTTLLGYGSSLGSALVVILAPLLGALSDQFGAKKRFLVAFAFLGIVATGSLALVEGGHPVLAVAFFVVANIGFSGANGFYDALLLAVTRGERLDRLSALGFSLGYAGSLVLFVMAVVTYQKPEVLGLSSTDSAIRLIFALVGAWWLVFTLPLMRWVAEPAGLRKAGAGVLATVAGALAELKDTVREVREYRQAAVFLVAYWLYIDGVHTVIKMAMAYATDLGFDPQVTLIAILLTNLIGVPATLLYARLAAAIGIKRAIMAGLAGYVVVTLGAPLMSHPSHFFLLAVIIGLAQGGVQAMSRSLFARLIPGSEAGKYYGFYNMVGKFASVLGPGLMATTALVLGDRLSILAIPVLLISGMILLTKVKCPAQERPAEPGRPA
jgi:UMF1 family MFS transporter